jgi:hypothetical protein
MTPVQHGRQSVGFDSRSRSVLRYSIAIVVCALAAHTAAYGSFLPDDSIHGYFAWYGPAVAVLSTVCISAAIVALLAGLVLGPASTPSAVIRAALPSQPRPGSSLSRLLGLAAGALVFLAVQETLERSLASGGLQLVSFAPATIAMILAAVLAAAGVVVLIGHVVRSLAVIVFRDRPRHPTRTTRRRRSLPRSVRQARLRPLTVHGGLRAPPFLV